MLFDMHLHSNYSPDALTKPETIVKCCKKNKWGFSLTDHNTMKAYSGQNSISKLAKKSKVLLIPGEEILVIKNGKICGEVVAYFLNTVIKPTSFANILDEVKRQDALLSCPHPFDWPRKNFKEFPKQWKKFTCMETYNARAYYQDLNVQAGEFANRKNVVGKISCLGVSDAHTPEEIGNGLTEINATSEEGVRKQLKKHKTTVLCNERAQAWHHFQTQLARTKIAKPR